MRGFVKSSMNCLEINTFARTYVPIYCSLMAASAGVYL